MSDASQRAAALRILAALDLTDLSDDADEAGLDRLCERALTPHGPVAAVCVWPRFVGRAAKALAGSGVRIATVANFPLGAGDVAAVLDEVDSALSEGADEIDLVIAWRALRAGAPEPTIALLDAVREATAGRPLKAILETGELATPALIAQASRLALDAGADFLKTSTGKTRISATPAAARVMLETIAASGLPAGFKASGGVRTLADATVYLDLTRDILGAAATAPERFRIGASGLLDALVAALDAPAA